MVWDETRQVIMANNEHNLTHGPNGATSLRSLLVPLLAAGLIFIVLVPVPPMVMDVLLAANIALAAIVFLTTLFVSSPLEFSVFPSVLLGATLLRLVLNIATTRLILTAGEGGRSVAEAQFAAGHVVWSFSQFVAAGSLVVGVILFCILAVIQFVVITKGASRISEVAARFVLDAMPGKQMAIDADLRANLIDETQARQQREAVCKQADFYGAMDGASKFLRGDAIAAVLITLVNIAGGIYVGMVQYGWSASQTAGLFTRLTIGDGLVTQIPALLITVSAALMVTRSTLRTDLSAQVVRQLTARPAALMVTAGFLLALTLTDLPKLPLSLIAISCVGLAWTVQSRQRKRRRQATPAVTESTQDQRDIERALRVAPIQIELGYSLLSFVDSGQGGDLLDRVAQLRRRLAGELGFVLPEVRIRDGVSLSGSEYTISVRGVFAKRGRLTKKQPAGDAIATLVEQLAAVAIRSAPELLTRQRVAEMIETLRGQADALVSEVGQRVSVGQVQRVLRALLAEGSSIRDFEAILDALCAAAETSDDAEQQIQAVRNAMGLPASRTQDDENDYLPAAARQAALRNA